jgi:integrase/recombinase XerD
MILGRGEAQTDEAITAEYHHFIDKYHQSLHPGVQQRYKRAPRRMQKRLNKPLADWTESDILLFYAEPDHSRRCQYCAFLSYLYFRGYVKPTFRLVVEYPGHFASDHKAALLTYRNRLDGSFEELGYVRSRWSRSGSELSLLIASLLISHKTLDEVTRADFEAFREQYQAWYRGTGQQKDGKANSHVARLEKCLVCWGVLTPVKTLYRHEVKLQCLKQGPLYSALLFYLEWCATKYAPSSVVSFRNGLLDFCLWFQATYPHSQRLDDITRPVALSYMRHLLELRERGQRSLNYCNDLYAYTRLFIEFTIRENLDTSPKRNPFGMKDIPQEPKHVRRYINDNEMRKVLAYCENGASLRERTVVIVLLHTGIRASELANLSVSDIVEIQGKWKLHIREGKGLKDRLIPLTPQCLAALQVWQEQGRTGTTDHLFTNHTHPHKRWQGYNAGAIVHNMGLKLGIEGLCPHRFRHTFAVALLNYGMRETALQKLLGHTTLNMTLQYARILDETVERAFETAVEQMQEGPLQWVPSFLTTEDYGALIEADTLNWIRLPLGYCRRHARLHCESDVKCLLCDRFMALPEDLPRLNSMHERFQTLGLTAKAEAVAAQIRRLEGWGETEALPHDCIAVCPETWSNPGLQTEYEVAP